MRNKRSVRCSFLASIMVPKLFQESELIMTENILYIQCHAFGKSCQS